MAKKRDLIINPESLDDVTNYIIYRTTRILKMKFKKDMESVGMDLSNDDLENLKRILRVIETNITEQLKTENYLKIGGKNEKVA